MWERGLKPPQGLRMQEAQGVAPHVGAWIETAFSATDLSKKLSLPMWERGLKHLLPCYPSIAHSRSPCGSVD